MNARWILIRRLRGPAFLLTFGVTAVLHQWDVLGFDKSWPLYLIVAGVLTLLERGALASMPSDMGPYPMGGYQNPGTYQYPNQPYPQGWSHPNPQPAATSTAIVTTGPTDIVPPEGRG